MDITQTLTSEFKLKPFQTENAVALLDAGNTVPFIARYRKELTGSMDDQTLRELAERLGYLRNLDEKREQVRKSIAEQEKLTDEISKALNAALTITEIEDIYRPFKPKRRTRATIAKEKGLEPLALILWAQETQEPFRELAMAFIDDEKGVASVEDAIGGAGDIVAEIISDDADIRKMIRQKIREDGFLTAKATDADAKSVYEMYYDFREPVKKAAGHRVLAMNRGEKEKFLNVKIDAPEEDILRRLRKMVVKPNVNTETYMENALCDSYKRLIAPSVEREIRTELTGTAEDGAMKVFSANLKQTLMQPPLKERVVMAIDPGYRTGCKVAVVDGTGKALDTAVIYPTPPRSDIEGSRAKLLPLIKKHAVTVIAIGNGTASRETEIFTADMIRDIDGVMYTFVNEAGASVYSASKLGAEEFPEYDVTIRGAISLARRLQDPLAELVKIDPKCIGVGQYQHDMNQKRLGDTLGGVVENCVNSVGVDLNTASPSLLSYVSGVSVALAKNIYEFRQSNGRFKSRLQLRKVSKLGPKAFEQCAGFLRIPGAENPLDDTGVHPESYGTARELLDMLNIQGIDEAKNIRKNIQSVKELATRLSIGAPTLEDIIRELEKPGRDPRGDTPPSVLRGDVMSLEDLTPGMVLEGTVRNAIDFGVFVDIGVHQDGLVHISQIAEKYIKHPLEAVSVGDVVKVKVLAVDAIKKRISLSIKEAIREP